jgi:hypothetical protein
LQGVLVIFFWEDPKNRENFSALPAPGPGGKAWGEKFFCEKGKFFFLM